MLTETVHLKEGVRIGQQQYKAVVLRAPIVRDTIEAEKQSEGKGMAWVSLFLLALSIVKLGSVDDTGEFTEEVPKEKVTVDLLTQLNETDLEFMTQAREYLKKKLLWQRDV